jgi:hypothetical protein
MIDMDVKKILVSIYSTLIRTLKLLLTVIGLLRRHVYGFVIVQLGCWLAGVVWFLGGKQICGVLVLKGEGRND